MSKERYMVSMRTFSIVLLDTHRPMGSQQVMATGWTQSGYKNKKLEKEYYDECDRLNAEHRKGQE